MLIDSTAVHNLNAESALPPMSAPKLPFPFTANHLAAFMHRGRENFVPEQFCGQTNGPISQPVDEQMVLLTNAKKELTDAFAAYHASECAAAPYDAVHVEKMLALKENSGQWSDLQKTWDAIQQLLQRAGDGFAERSELMANELLTTMRTGGEFVHSKEKPATALGADTPIPKQRLQENRILQLLKEHGYAPAALPPHIPGRPGPKAAIKKVAMKEPKVFTSKSFEKAWERLKFDERVAYCLGVSPE